MALYDPEVAVYRIGSRGGKADPIRLDLWNESEANAGFDPASRIEVSSLVARVRNSSVTEASFQSFTVAVNPLRYLEYFD